MTIEKLECSLTEKQVLADRVKQLESLQIESQASAGNSKDELLQKTFECKEEEKVPQSTVRSKKRKLDEISGPIEEPDAKRRHVSCRLDSETLLTIQRIKSFRL